MAKRATARARRRQKPLSQKLDPLAPSFKPALAPPAPDQTIPTTDPTSPHDSPLELPAKPPTPRAPIPLTHKQLNRLRRKICPRSPFWHLNFDLTAHRAAWQASHPPPQPIPTPSHAPPLRAPFDGKHIYWCAPYSSVLAQPTVFCPQWPALQAFAPAAAAWPSQHEQQYEGDDRIRTDDLHGRFPGLPRVVAPPGVDWRQCARVVPLLLDDVRPAPPCEVEVFLHTHWIPELEVGDEEGARVLGAELWGCLVEGEDAVEGVGMGGSVGEGVGSEDVP